MTVVFIVVGALGYLGYFIAIPTFIGVTNIQSTIATTEVESAYNSLSAATQTFRASTQACASISTSAAARLQCLEQADTTWSQALQSYGSTISGITYPSSSQSAASAAEGAVTVAVSMVDQLAGSPNLSAYVSAASSPELQAALSNVDTTYNRLVASLSTG